MGHPLLRNPHFVCSIVVALASAGVFATMGSLTSSAKLNQTPAGLIYLVRTGWSRPLALASPLADLCNVCRPP